MNIIRLDQNQNLGPTQTEFRNVAWVSIIETVPGNEVKVTIGGREKFLVSRPVFLEGPFEEIRFELELNSYNNACALIIPTREGEKPPRFDFGTASDKLIVAAAPYANGESYNTQLVLANWKIITPVGIASKGSPRVVCVQNNGDDPIRIIAAERYLPPPWNSGDPGLVALKNRGIRILPGDSFRVNADILLSGIVESGADQVDGSDTIAWFEFGFSSLMTRL